MKVTYRGPGGSVVPLVAGDDLHDGVVGVGGQSIAPPIQPKRGPTRQPEVKHQIGGLLEQKKNK